ncbi:hypothetical protein HOY82DRAFT_467742, partial [Tuber indicum]
MPPSRSRICNIRFYDASDPTVVLAGFYQNGSITEANILSILEIFIEAEGKSLRIQARGSNHIVTQNDLPLAIEDYDLYCNGPIRVNQELLFNQHRSNARSARQTKFMKEIRARDAKCVISGIAMTEDLMQIQEWCFFDAAHIFPVQWESLWVKFGFLRFITDMDDDNTGSTKIHSCQNGFLLNKVAHSMFDRYMLSVNVDGGYKVVVFADDIMGYHGRVLDPARRNPDDPHHISDDLLRWHFRQFVLCNMRGGAEPTFEEDFQREPDKVHDIR